MAASDGITFTPWPREDYPHWSLPALRAAKCVARQGPEAFERLHLLLYEALFTRSVNIARAEERNGDPLADDVAMLLLTGDQATS